MSAQSLSFGGGLGETVLQGKEYEMGKTRDPTGQFCLSWVRRNVIRPNVARTGSGTERHKIGLRTAGDGPHGPQG